LGRGKTIAIVALLLLAAALGLLPVAPLTSALVAFGYRAWRPQDISWDAKDAWSKCEGAIAGAIPWPTDPASARQAILMCANEAPLSEAQRQTLENMVQP
jgi:hypothetical protein